MGPANLVTPKWDIYMRKWRSGVHSTAHQSTPEHTHWFDQIDMYANVCRTHCHMEDKTHTVSGEAAERGAHTTQYGPRAQQQSMCMAENGTQVLVLAIATRFFYTSNGHFTYMNTFIFRLQRSKATIGETDIK